MVRTKRRTLLRIASRIRKARGELDKAEQDLEALLGARNEQPAAIETAAASNRVAEAMAALLEGESSVLRREHAATSGAAVLNAMIDVVTGTAGRSLARQKGPSTIARVLAVLMEEPKREFKAASVALRAGCSEPVARTVLSRLVKQGHARRSRNGSFQATS